MIKKGLSIFVFVLTSFVLLAHAVVPHHHHNLEVCLAGMPSASHTPLNHPQDCDENHNHEHESDDSDLSCILEKIVIFRSENTELGDKFVQVSKYELDSFYIAIFSVAGTNEFCTRELKIPTPTNLKSNYTFQAPDAFGLRAPPLV